MKNNFFCHYENQPSLIFFSLSLWFSCLLSEFENLAIGVLDECYNEDEVLSEMLVERDLSKWGGMCALKLAAAAKAKRFLAHPCCQSSLNSLWKSRGMPRVKYWKVRSAQKCQVSLTWPEPVSKLESVSSLLKFVKTFSLRIHLKWLKQGGVAIAVHLCKSI